MSRLRYYSGYSLPELLICLAITAIVAGQTAPAFSQLIDKQKRFTTLHTVHHSIALARIESIKRNHEVILCPSDDGENCASSFNYSPGWIIFENTDRDYPAIRDQDEPLIQYISLTTGNFELYANRKAFSFRSINKRNTNGTLIVCPKDTTEKQHIYQSVVLSYTGRPRIEQPAQRKHERICDR